MLLPRMQQSALRQRAMSSSLRSAVAQGNAATTWSQEPRAGRVQFRGLWESGRQQGTLPGPCQPAEERTAATPTQALLRYEGSVPIRRLLKTSCSWRLLRRARCPVLQRAAPGATLQAQGGMRFPWLQEAPFRTWLLPGSLATDTGEATARASSRAERLAHG
jgi:hypothetical protein